MSSTLDARPEVARYLAAVRGALGDLPASEREDLLAEGESSLLETADESGNVAARLGPPDEFAAELRAAAGLAPIVERSRRPLRERLASLRSPALHTRVRELAPIWWVARGYVAVAFI